MSQNVKFLHIPQTYVPEEHKLSKKIMTKIEGMSRSSHMPSPLETQ